MGHPAFTHPQLRYTSSMLVAELNDVLEQTLAIEADVNRVLSALPVEALSTRPSPRSWSISEILVHLRLTADQCLPALDAGIRDARSHNLLSNGPFELGLKGRFFLWYVEPPPKIKLPAPKVLAELPAMSPEEAVAAYRQGHQLVMQRLEAANGLDLVRATFRSPFASFITMDLLTVFRVFTAHERRHLWQMHRTSDLVSR